MSELQAGMLALVTGYVRLPESVGKVVTLIAEDMLEWENEKAWLVEGLDDAMFVRARHLLPLPPLQDPLDVTETQELHA